jgi:DNA-binding NarL/FixJ family response regulator
MGDMIKHKHNGYLAKPFRIDDLYEGIKYCVSRRKELSENSVLDVQNYFSETVVAEKYISTYKELNINKEIQALNI